MMVELIQGATYELEGKPLLAVWNEQFHCWSLLMANPVGATSHYVLLGKLVMAVSVAAPLGSSGAVLWGTDYVVDDLRHIGPSSEPDFDIWGAALSTLEG
jgi:hypothetical protein